jgi:GT2 family glycosyltransferase
MLDIGYSNMDILLVDNGSTDGSAEKLRAEFEGIKCLFLDQNLGFGVGHNEGIRWANEHDAEYVMLVNNDTIFPANGLLEELVGTMEKNTDIGILTPQVYQTREQEDCYFRRGVIDYETAMPDYEYPVVEEGSELLDNDYIPFIAALIRPDVFDTVGLYPEEYFLYYADLDYCTRISQAGFEIKTYLPGRVYHGGSNTSGESLAPIRSYYNMRNRFMFARNFPDLVDISSFYRFSVIHICYQSARRIYYGNFGGLIALLRGTIDGFLGKEGKGPYP